MTEEVDTATEPSPEVPADQTVAGTALDQSASADATVADEIPSDTASSEASPSRDAPAGRGRHSSPPRNPWRRRITEWVALVLVVVLVSLGIRTFALQAFFVPSGSMIPALQIGDRLLVDKLFFHPSSLHRGDVVVFSHPPKEHCGAVVADLVKRVIALPGQTIWSKDGTIYIATGKGPGRAISEPYLPADDPLGMPIARQKIPPNQYFVMGDNRMVSCDSRYWGPVPGNLIIGKVVLVWWRNGHPDFKTL